MASLALKGELPTQIIAQVKGEPQGVRLVLSAALAFQAAADEVERKYGWRPHVTSPADALRTYNTQVKIFLQRYRTTFAQVTQPDGRKVTDQRTWNGVKYWRWQGAAAAVPGTGNHPKGVAVDVEYMAYGTKRFQQWSEVAIRHGWSNKEGASVGEAWHWVHLATLTLVDNYIITGKMPSLGAPVGALPDPLTPEDDMSAEDVSQIKSELAIIKDILSGQVAGDVALIRGDTDLLPQWVADVGERVDATKAWVGTVADEVRAVRVQNDILTRVTEAALNSGRAGVGVTIEAVKEIVAQAVSDATVTITPGGKA